MKRRHELEELMQRVAAHQVATRSKASRTTVLAKRDGDTAGISYAAISRVGGGAAVGTTLGTAITPGLGTIAGAILGGVVGAFAPSVLSHKKSSRRRKGRAITRSR
jgi:outer membrane lipoprotein SlyB